MVVFHACPRCGRGDLLQERDEVGPYWRCLQCGHPLTSAEVARLELGGPVLPLIAAARRLMRAA
jgi:uncharacterized protein (DUF983 family)